jgi:hypothetical protein
MLLSGIRSGLVDGFFDSRDGDPATAWFTIGFARRGRIAALIVRFSQLDCTTADVKCSPRVATDSRNFSTSKLNSIWVDDVARDTLKA